jgi:uncharacterized protein
MPSHAATDLVLWQPGSVTAETSEPAADCRLGGHPVHSVRNLYADPTAQFFAGTWSSTVGRWRVRYTEHEFCQLTRGRIRIESDAGRSWELGPGDSFIVPAGFTGVWDVLEPAEKMYVIFEPRPSGTPG